MKFGAHCSTSGGFYRAVQRCKEIQGQSCQIFVKNNMQWFGRMPLASELALYRKELSGSGISCVFGHCNYLINLAAPPSANRDKSITSLVQEIEIATALRLPFLVMHPGAHLGAGEAAGLQRVVEGLDAAFAATPRSRVRIALENTAGQGSCLGHSLWHLGWIIERLKKPRRAGICLDTAHLFAAGYDVREPPGWNAALREIHRTAGLEQVLGFHLNDSKTVLGSRVDRHAHIGQGHIGLKGFSTIVNDRRFRGHPGTIETPKSADLHEDKENLAALGALVKRKRP